jgi:hypothetical protein
MSVNTQLTSLFVPPPIQSFQNSTVSVLEVLSEFKVNGSMQLQGVSLYNTSAAIGNAPLNEYGLFLTSVSNVCGATVHCLCVKP